VVVYWISQGFVTFGGYASGVKCQAELIRM